MQEMGENDINSDFQEPPVPKHIGKLGLRLYLQFLKHGSYLAQPSLL